MPITGTEKDVRTHWTHLFSDITFVGVLTALDWIIPSRYSDEDNTGDQKEIGND